MAKRKRASIKRATKRRSYFTTPKRKKSSSSGSGNMNPQETAMYGFGYGAIRSPIAVVIDKWTSQLPVPVQLADEVALGIGAWIGMKKFKKPMLKKLARTALTVESYRAGDTIASPFITGMIGGSSSTTGTNAGAFVN